MRNSLVFALSGVFALVLACPSLAQEKKQPDPEKVLADALKNIKEKDKIGLRIQAAMDLADFGPRAEPALNDLLDALQTKNEDLRLNAAIALGKIGKASVKPVAELLKSDDVDTKFYAIWTIGWIGPDAGETVPAMIRLAGDKNDGIRRKAIYALGRLAGDSSKTIAVLVAAFKDDAEDVRQAAGEALVKFGKEAVPHLIELLKSDKPSTRTQASTSLGAIGADAKDAVPHLKERFLSETDIAQHYAQVLAKIGKHAVPALEAGFKDSRPGVRNAAAMGLQKVGADAVGVLVDGLGDKNVEVRRLAAQTLWPMNIGDKSVVIALAFGLSDADDLVRQNCMNALAALGPQAKLAAPKLKEALVDLNQHVRQQAFHLLNQCGEDPRPQVKKNLASKDDKVRINTASLMVTVGFDVTSATPVLLEALKHDDLALRMQAASTMAQRNLQKDNVRPIFLEGLKYSSPGVRIQACQGLAMLGNFGSGGDDAVKALAATLRDADTQVRQQALYALHNQGGNLSGVVPTLIELATDRDISNRLGIISMLSRGGDAGAVACADLLKDKDVNVRVQAIQTLRNMGKTAAKALPAVKTALSDENANVRLNAVLIMASIGGEGPQFIVKHFETEKDATTRSQLLQNLVYNNQGKQALPLLPVAMKDPAVQVRQTAVNMLYAFDRNSKESFEVFTLGLKDSDNSVRTQAAYNAGNYGKKAWEPLVDAMKSTKDLGVRQAILQGMMGCQFRAKSGVAPLIDCLKDDNATLKQWACIVLGSIGPDAADALPRLRELAKSDGNTGVQSQARAAIQQIEKKK